MKDRDINIERSRWMSGKPRSEVNQMLCNRINDYWKNRGVKAGARLQERVHIERFLWERVKQPGPRQYKKIMLKTPRTYRSEEITSNLGVYLSNGVTRP